MPQIATLETAIAMRVKLRPDSPLSRAESNSGRGYPNPGGAQG